MTELRTISRVKDRCLLKQVKPIALAMEHKLSVSVAQTFALRRLDSDFLSRGEWLDALAFLCELLSRPKIALLLQGKPVTGGAKCFG